MDTQTNKQKWNENSFLHKNNHIKSRDANGAGRLEKLDDVYFF